MSEGRANYIAPSPPTCGDCGERPVDGRVWHILGCEFDSPADHRRLIPGPELTPLLRLVVDPASPSPRRRVPH